jgi:8-oxo-dGTP diphosphatase
MDELRPKVGLGVMIFKDGKVLVSRRRNRHGDGEYAFPGGHLEHLESIEECARREIREECGIEVGELVFLCVTNLKAYAPRHYVDLGFVCEWKSGEVRTLEPEKHTHWFWCDPEMLPAPLFGATANYLEAWKTGKNFFDT